MELFFALIAYPFWLALDIIVSDPDFPEPFVGWCKRGYAFIRNLYEVDKKPRRKRPPLVR